jgi:peptidoglycan/LPS O-acetylase OafA/YrhL
MHHVDDRQSEPFSNDLGIGYMPTVDGLRGIAILFVLWYHAPFLFRDLPQFSVIQQSPWALLGAFGRMSLGGWIGVDLFFVISGFLITLILLRIKEGAGSSLAFWGRRALRILPLAVLYLAVLIGLTSLGDPLKMLSSFDRWAWYAFYVGNIHIAIYGWQPLAVMILWSLAIEEQFYLIWPLIVRACAAHQILRCSISLMVIAPLTRAVMLSAADYPATYVFTFCRVDALAAGAALAVLFNTPKTQRQTTALCKRLVGPAMAAIAIIMLVPFSPSLPAARPWWFSIFGYSCLAISFAIVLGASLEIQGPIRAVLTSSVLTFLGRRCYGLYLWHVVAAGCVIAAVQRWEAGVYLYVILWLVMLVMMASASWLFFERPILSLKRFLPYQQRPRTIQHLHARIVPSYLPEKGAPYLAPRSRDTTASTRT